MPWVIPDQVSPTNGTVTRARAGRAVRYQRIETGTRLTGSEASRPAPPG